MTINRFTANSEDELYDTLEKLGVQELPVYILFIGKMEDEADGNEENVKDIFCLKEIKRVLQDVNDGEDVETVINEYLSYIPEERSLNYVCCYVTQGKWGPGSSLCADPTFRLLRVPTLMRLNGPQRLEMGEVTRFPLLHLLFEEDPPETSEENLSQESNTKIKEVLEDSVTLKAPDEISTSSA